MKRVVELEIQLENLQHGAVSSSTSNESHSVDSKDMAGLKIRIKSLERELQKKKEDAEKLETKMMEQAEKSKAALETLQRKDHEMQAMEERYKKYIEKAKMVLKTLDPKHNPALNVTPEVAALQAQLKEKDKLIERLEVEAERHKALRDNEDQLVTTAFYNLVIIIAMHVMGENIFYLLIYCRECNFSVKQWNNVWDPVNPSSKIKLLWLPLLPCLPLLRASLHVRDKRMLADAVLGICIHFFL